MWSSWPRSLTLARIRNVQDDPSPPKHRATTSVRFVQNVSRDEFFFFLFQVSAAAPLSRAVRTYSINRPSSTAAAAVTGSSNRHSPFSISSTLSTNPTRYNPSLLTASEKKNLYGWKVKSMENKYIRKRRRKGGASMKGVKAIKREKSRPPHIFHQEREREGGGEGSLNDNHQSPQQSVLLCIVAGCLLLLLLL